MLRGTWILDTKSNRGNPSEPAAMSAAVAPLKRRRLVDDAVQMLRAAILKGRMVDGARLRQTDLADQLGISRTPIREALVRLQQERSEEHTSELQSRLHLVCRLLLEKKKTKNQRTR